MSSSRVVITGMGAVSPLGVGVAALTDGLRRGMSGVVSLRTFRPDHALATDCVGLARGFDGSSIPRNLRRTMSRMSQFAYVAAKEALESARVPAELLHSPRCGLVAGSTLGSSDAMEEFFAAYLGDHALSGVRTHTFFKIMSHSVSANLVQALDIRGRAEGLAAACATGCQAVGLGYELISAGRQDIMLCGAADEYHLLVSGVFDLLGAGAGASRPPEEAARPFDAGRTGIACAEGAGMLTLESLEHAKKRGAPILAEVAGYAPSVTTSNIAHPEKEELLRCMSGALADAGLSPADVDYVSAHATGTVEGDIAEGLAIAELFGPATPVSSLKGHLGHTMAASGALELIATVHMLRDGLLIPTRNLDSPDPACGGINCFTAPLSGRFNTALKNSFALGGFNASLLVRTFHD